MVYRDGVYSGHYIPESNGLYRVSLNAYRRNPNVPFDSNSRLGHPFRFALPINQGKSSNQ